VVSIEGLLLRSRGYARRNHTYTHSVGKDTGSIFMGAVRLDAPTLVLCPQCNQLMRSHYVCKNCGSYRGRQVIEQRSNTGNE
jgi:large subunit ribosomal protein L32